jgi:hypothetical protein
VITERSAATFPPPGARTSPRTWSVERDDDGVTARDGRGSVARAEIRDDASRVDLVFWVDERLPRELRRKLARTAFEHPALRPDRPVAVALPPRETDVLREVRSHLAEQSTRVAGATVLVEGRMR